jgi:4'-phosphopantetheinyl transferase
MSENINKITKLNLTANISEDKLLDQLVFNTSTNRVFIFTVNLTSYINNISKCWECLSVKEKIQANKYYTKSLSDKYIMSHGILRYILSHYTKQYPKDIEFTHNEYGKPFLKNSNIYFNMSHSHNMVSYIVALNQRVGIDIEMHDNNLNVQELASLVLTSGESQYLSSLNSKEKFALFYHLWTKKESLIKANGQGLSYPINTIEAIALSSGINILLFTNEKNILQQEEWYYYELETPKNYSGAIAIENKIDEIVYLEMNNPPNIFGNIKLKCLA